MVRLHPSEFLGGDGCKTIGQEFDGEFDLFEQGVQLASSYNQSRPQQMSEGQRYQTTGPARLSG